MNLVGSSDHDALQVHVADSLAAVEELPEGARVVDLGSGAGFPGVPIAICRPDLELWLVDSRERRIHFLRHVARELGLECVIRRCRIEDGAPSLFDVALLRAVAPLKRALPLAAPWVAPGGQVWIWTREQPEAELEQGAPPLELGERGRILRLAVKS